jgi:nitrate reductase alpha subunit
MAASNKFYQFATLASSDNILSDAQYLIDEERTSGNVPGIARQQLVNKALKQAASLVYTIGEIVSVKTNLEIADDGVGLDALSDYLTKAFIPVYTETQSGYFLNINTDGTSVIFNSPESLAATTSIYGLVRIATQAEVEAGTEASKIVTPGTLKKNLANGVAPVDANIKVPIANLPDASTSAKGIVQIATQAEVTSGTNIEKVITPASLAQKLIDTTVSLDSNNKVPLANLYDASTSNKGIAQIATQEEVNAGTNTLKIVTPATLTAVLNNILVIDGGSF